MKTCLVIHGHFYQPPRRNPYTGIMAFQPSAAPFDNWNEHIYRTCYLPNAYSRYLDIYGKIKDITNNYCSISSNFGPTLLEWIENKHPDLLLKLREADAFSIKKTGHSNFLAQCYNHTILPLDSPETRRIEISWAIKDYTRHFEHKPEGFWCSECAIDAYTIDILAENGIKFTVLSPWQAVKINNRNLNGLPAPCDRPFVINGNRNHIAAFFYNPEFASGISFGHYLRNADSLYEKLLSTVRKENHPALLSWATDGEIYGHHEPFGDMALAALIKKINSSDEIELTNYGAFLEKNPPVDTAVLSTGDDGLGSSWSCSHGVGRWYKDCGCHTGGDDKWNQKWRTPLREALKFIESKAYEIFYAQAETILGSREAAQQLLDNYYEVACSAKDTEQYIGSFRTPSGSAPDEKEAKTLACLLTAMHNVLLSFTSCGWFFNDISGIEPRQNISFAVNAASILQEFTKANLLQQFLRILKNARSNISSEGTAEDIAKKDYPQIPAFVKAGIFFIFNRTIAEQQDSTDVYGFFKLLSFEGKELTVRDTGTLKTYRLSYSTITSVEDNKTVSITLKDSKTGLTYNFNSSDISPESLKQFAQWIEEKIISYMGDIPLNRFSENIEQYMILINSNKTSIFNNIFIENMSLCIKAIKCRLKTQGYNVRSATELEHLRRLSRFANTSGIDSQIADMKDIFSNYISHYSDKAKANLFTEEDAENLTEILTIAHNENLVPDTTEIQNVFFPLLKDGNSLNIDAKILKRLSTVLNFSF